MIIADLHIHSKYSRAVSQQMIVPNLTRWARYKGINLLGTGDFTHPQWLRELKAQLEIKENGFYTIKKELVEQDLDSILKKDKAVYFVPTTEISSIYSQGGKARKIHTVIIAPDFEIVAKINQALSKIGNLSSDGRPILGLSIKDLAEIVLETSEDCLIIPAHIWTPWFSLFGSKSGFDSIEEGFGDYSKYIYGIETGLSSDPAMNWRIEELDNRSILSFSDAHSLPKLGREVTVFEMKNEKREGFDGEQFGPELTVEGLSRTVGSEKFSYQDLVGAIKQDPSSRAQIAYTIEFYAEEGKYHYTGHRECGVRQAPNETKNKGVICPVCMRPLTVGVMHRVEDLAVDDRDGETVYEMASKTKTEAAWIKSRLHNRPSYISLVQLYEIIAESLGIGTSSKRVETEYFGLVNSLAPEFEILLKTKLEDISRRAGEKLSQAIKKVRQRDIFVDPGYDGVFGAVKIWGDEGVSKEVQPKVEQLSLF